MWPVKCKVGRGVYLLRLSHKRHCAFSFVSWVLGSGWSHLPAIWRCHLKCDFFSPSQMTGTLKTQKNPWEHPPKPLSKSQLTENVRDDHLSFLSHCVLGDILLFNVSNWYSMFWIWRNSFSSWCWENVFKSALHFLTIRYCAPCFLGILVNLHCDPRKLACIKPLCEWEDQASERLCC